MYSPNITHIPLNRDGAIELGRSPCSVCDAGWGNCSQGKDGKSTSETCHTTCELLKRFSDQQTKGEALLKEESRFFGTHIREVIRTFKEVFKKG